jgi:predicted MFS family arabinose efflux permease
VGAGIVSAFQVGKAPIALADVQTDLKLDLSVASWLLSAFAIVGALFGIVIGLAVDHIGAKRMALGGLLLQAVGSIVGATSDGAGILLTTRVVEGIGFLAVIVAAPALIVSLVRAEHLGPAMAAWATFMPLGMTLVMFASPLLEAFGWRNFWLINAAVLASYAALLAWKIHLPLLVAANPARNVCADVRSTLADRGPWLLAGLFAAFTAAYFAVFGFLPSLLSERLAVSQQVGSVLSGIAVVASAAGNVIGGQVLAREVSRTKLIVVSFVAMALCGFGVFSSYVPGELAFVLSLVFSTVSGTVPVALFNAVPDYAPRPELVGASVGFLIQ